MRPLVWGNLLLGMPVPGRTTTFTPTSSPSSGSSGQLAWLWLVACATGPRKPLGRAQPSGPDADQLWTAAAAGDEHAFSQLVESHSPRLWRLAWAMLRDDTAAAEAVQDTWLRAWRHADDFQGDASITTWLHTICRRACLDRLRRKRLSTVPLEDATLARSSSAGIDDTAVVRDALDALPPDLHDAIVLIDILGYPSHEAAEILNTAPSTLRSRLARGRALLVEALT